jgi:hypothetical protein
VFQDSAPPHLFHATLFRKTTSKMTKIIYFNSFEKFPQETWEELVLNLSQVR